MVKLAYKSKVHKLSNKSVGILVLRLFEASVAANVALVINSKSYTALTEVNNRYQASVDPTKYKFNNNSAIKYNVKNCSNVSCHFKKSPNWTTGQ